MLTWTRPTQGTCMWLDTSLPSFWLAWAPQTQQGPLKLFTSSFCPLDAFFCFLFKCDCKITNCWCINHLSNRERAGQIVGFANAGGCQSPVKCAIKACQLTAATRWVTAVKTRSEHWTKTFPARPTAWGINAHHAFARPLKGEQTTVWGGTDCVMNDDDKKKKKTLNISPSIWRVTASSRAVHVGRDTYP